MEENKNLDPMQEPVAEGEGYCAEEQSVQEQPDAVSQTVVQNQPAKPAEKKKHSGVAIAALICGIAGFFFNPLYAVTLAAIVLGIIGIATAKDRPKGLAVTGLVLGCIALPTQLGIDLVMSVFTFGLSFCV